MNEPVAKTLEAEEDEISLLDLLQVVADNLRLLVLGPLAAGLLALGYTLTITPTFTATTKFIPPSNSKAVQAPCWQAWAHWVVWRVLLVLSKILQINTSRFLKVAACKTHWLTVLN